jgi:exodeoxyribonuclease-3
MPPLSTHRRNPVTPFWHHPHRMRVATWNVNGLRAIERKGFLPWLESCGADVVFLQEIKALPEQLSDEVREPRGWHVELNAAEKPGYSGVAVYSRERPDEVVRGLGAPLFDAEGRVISARFGDLHLVGAYFPNGARDLSRVPFKLEFYETMLAHANRLREQGLHVLVTGDWNTAHQEIDLARPKDNVKTTGFLPQERESLTKFLAAGWADAFRRLNPDARERYTWWAPWRGSRERNIGWRIDYPVVDEALLGRIGSCEIHHDVKGSDHCPVTIEVKA